MRIPIDRQSAIPLYQQIETYLRESILSGSLAPETRLPATRQLAQDLGISRITVENAYAVLESDGLVFSRAGSGTYVLPSGPLPPLPREGARAGWPLWQQDAQVGVGVAQENVSTETFEAVRHPRPIAFTGFGDPRQFPVKDFYKAVKLVMRRDGTAALEFDDIRGYSPLRATIAHVLASQGLPARPERILITSGSQQALALIAQILLRPGDVVLVENPTYDVALELFRSQNLKIVGCPTDAWGMQVELLEPLLQQHHPKLIYRRVGYSSGYACQNIYPRRS